MSTEYVLQYARMLRSIKHLKKRSGGRKRVAKDFKKS
jgi:hypothetical protein